MEPPCRTRGFLYSYRAFQAFALIVAPSLLLAGVLIDASAFGFRLRPRSSRLRANADSNDMENDVPSPHLHPEHQ
jgi:hypothetical protein